MKLIGLSDPHMTSKTPRGRIGNVLKDAKKKFLYIFKYAKKINAHILIAGDLFNTPRDILALFVLLSITSRFPEVKLFAVYGQHDMYMRNKDVLTNLGILSRSGVLKILSEFPKRFIDEGVNIYGTSWNGDIPEPITFNKTNILVIHAPLYERELFPGHKFTNVMSFIKKNNKFDFILAGDIHRRFKAGYKSTVIANTGPMMRLEASEYMFKHRPNFIVYDTDKKSVETIFIPSKDSLDVLSESAQKEVIRGNYTGISNAIINEGEINDINILMVVKELIEASKNKGVAKVLSNIIEGIDI